MISLRCRKVGRELFDIIHLINFYLWKNLFFMCYFYVLLLLLFQDTHKQINDDETSELEYSNIKI